MRCISTLSHIILSRGHVFNFFSLPFTFLPTSNNLRETIDSSEVERGERRQGSAALLPSWDSNDMSSGLSVDSAGSAVEDVHYSGFSFRPIPSCHRVVW